MYVVYVDESGDHGIRTVDPDYPVFVLAFCVFQIEDYIEEITPAFQRFKFKHFGHDQVVLHERDIRKARPPFQFLRVEAQRVAFMNDLNSLVEEAPFKLIASVINKEGLIQRYHYPANPYEAAMAFGLERIFKFLRSQSQLDQTTHIIFESRGRREDDELELEFRRVCDGANYDEQQYPFKIEFTLKATNCCGIQLADLLARPIGRRVLNPSQPNRAYEIFEDKFHRSETGRIRGYGLKVFP